MMFIRVVIACVLTALSLQQISVANVSAQELSQSPTETATQWQGPYNRLSVGIGHMGLVGGVSAGLWLSAMYSRTIVPGIDVEVALQKAGSSSYREYFSSSPAVTNQYFLGFHDVLALDATAMFSPFRSGVLSGLRLGIGATAQNLQQGVVREYPYSSGGLPLDPTLRQYPPSYYSYNERLSLGGNLKLDYLFPITQTLDVGIRTQAHILLYRLNDEPVKTFADGAASVGAFLSVKF